MAKKSSTLPLNLPEPASGTPLYRWLYEELRSAILGGNLRPGARLPATRDLAAQYDLSRPTIVSAFEQLREEGYVEGKVGSGTYVSQTLPEELLQAPRTKSTMRARRRRIRLSDYAGRLQALSREAERAIPRGLTPARVLKKTKDLIGTAERAADKPAFVTSGAKARNDKTAVIAALKRCATQNQIGTQDQTVAQNQIGTQNRGTQDQRSRQNQAAAGSPTSAPEGDIDNAGLTARLEVVPFPGTGTDVSFTAASESVRTHTFEQRNFRTAPAQGVRTVLRPARAFRASQPALDAFPTSLWAQVAARRLRRVSAGLLAGGEALGYRPLREAVADYLNTSRGVKCAADQVLIISGVQEALDRTAHLLLNPGDPVWMEEPGYPGAAMAFRAVGARICPVPVDAEGLNLPAGQQRWPRPRLAYVTPAHQFPLGVTMSLPRRLALLEWARRSGTVIFEDDYDSEYRYSGRPIPALQGLDRAGVVIFAGSFSDVLFPALRLGYLVAPADMVDIFAAAESVSTHHPPLIDQAILCDFISQGHFARHVRRMRELYAERLSVLIESAQQRLAGLLEIPDVEAGLRTVGWLQGGVSAEQAAQAAAQHDVEVVPLSRYAYGRSKRNGLVLGFAAVDKRELKRGVEGLARALEEGR